MQFRSSPSLSASRIAIAACLLAYSSIATAQVSAPPRAQPWNSSHVKGTPEPPLPYKAIRIFSNVVLDRPTDISWVPSASKWVATQSGGQLVMFENDPAGATAEPFLDLSQAAGSPVYNAFAVKFHPNLAEQPWCFVTFIAKQKDPTGVQLGRLRVLDPRLPTVDPDSLEVLLGWSSFDHMGGSIQFGPDGMLYLSIGDGQRPNPPDPSNTGQDVSDLQSSILRIDVDNPTQDRSYRIPPDNPFVGRPGAREEIWAYGLRNPFKLAFDPNSNDLLAADVGWESREMVQRIEKGRNFGWSLMEGSQPVKQGITPDTPITPPLFEHTHIDSRSISGGHYWQSERIKELMGAYIYGDWMTGKIWALKHDGDTLLWQKELADTPLQIIDFGVAPNGEVLGLAYDGTILRLDPNTTAVDSATFPRSLSKTGLFADVLQMIPEEGVVEYGINAPRWADGTYSRQWIAIPGAEQLQLYNKSDWQTGNTQGRFNFPADTVLAKTVFYDSPQGDERRLETQLLHRYEDDWRAYNYVWNEEQTDAFLQDDQATQRKITIVDSTSPSGLRNQTWRHASRSECLLCHIWAGGSVHGFWPQQLSTQFAGRDQLERLTARGLFKHEIPKVSALAAVHDTSQPLTARARSYLALNCSTCHRKQGGGTANFNFDLTQSLGENGFVDASPAQGGFGISEPRVVASGDPLRSVLIYRMLKSGPGHMPQFGSQVVDSRGIQLLRQWIKSLPSDNGEKESTAAIVAKLEQSYHDAPDEAEASIASMLSTSSGALAVSLTCGELSLDAALRDAMIRLGSAHENPMVRDLFEHYLPEEQRIRRLGSTIDASALLSIVGSPGRGKRLFETAKDINCRSCHRIGSVGQNVGPELSLLGTKQSRAEILDSIITPSAKIDLKFRAQSVLTTDGEVLTGVITKQTHEGVSLVDSAGRLHVIAAEDIESLRASAKSNMPDNLLSGMTEQQAADLLAYLSAKR